MIDLFFACKDCKIYIDCGGRWAYWQLEESKLLARNGPANVEAILRADQYWNPPKTDESRWLYEEVFPPLKAFLQNHSTHDVVFGEKDYFTSVTDDTYFDWMQVGYAPSLSPRYLVEVLRIKHWEQVCEYIQSLPVPPSWWEVNWMDPSPRERARRKFEKLTSDQTASSSTL